jgi:hypothetical protein
MYPAAPTVTNTTFPARSGKLHDSISALQTQELT